MAETKLDVVIGAQTNAAQTAINGFLGRVEGQFRSFTGGLTAQLAALFSIGALERFAQKTIDNAEEMGRMADKTGMAVEQFSALAYAAKILEVHQEALVMGLKNYQLWMAKTGHGQEDLLKSLLQTAEEMRQTGSAAERTAIATDRFGRSGQQMLPMLREGADGIRKMMGEAKDLGQVIGSDFTAQAEEFNRNITRMKAAGQGFGNSVMRDILPGLLRLEQMTGRMGINVESLGKFYTYTTALPALIAALAKLSPPSIPAAAPVAGGGEPKLSAEQIAAIRTAELKLENEALQASYAQEFITLNTYYEQRRAKILEEYEIERHAAGDDQAKAALAEVAYREKLLKQDTEYFQEKKQLREKDAKETEALSKRLLSAIDKSPFLSDEQKRQSSVGMMGQDIATLQKKGGSQDYIAQLREQRDTMQKMGTFSGQMQAQLARLMNQLGTAAQNAAAIVTNTLGAAFNAISTQISGLIMGTVTWGQALQNVGMTILTTLIQAIVQFFVSYIAQIVLAAIIGTVTTVASAATASAAWAGPAILASIATEGEAAVLGPIAVIAALATAPGIAALAAVPKAEGGWLSGGQLALVGERGPELFMPSSGGTVVSNAALRSGTGRRQSQAFYFVDDKRTAIREALNSPEAETRIMEIFGKNRHFFT